MPRLTKYLIGLALALAGASALAKTPDPPGKLLAAIEMVEGWKPIKERTGWWFYAVQEPGDGGPIVTGYEFSNGKIVDEFGGNSAPELIDELNQVGLEQFDFEAEAKEARDRLFQDAVKRGEEPLVGGVRDGARFKIVIVTKAGTFNYEAWNPGLASDTLALASEKISRLKLVFDLLRHFYVDSKLQF